MNCLQLRLPSSFSDTAKPKLRLDPILTTGSLVLVDFAHPANPAAGYIAAASGAPANGASVFNIAHKEAAALLGAGTAASLAGAFRLAGGINNGTKGHIERTAKGGVHGIVSKATALASGDGASLNIASALRSYLAANSGHQFYVSVWDRLTRPGTGGSNHSTFHDLTAGAFSAGLEFASLRTNGTTWSQPGGNAPDNNIVTDLNTTLGARYASGRITAASFASGAAAQQFGAIWGAPAGSYNAAVLATRNNTWASFAHYRFYLEDLTVSGRTFAEVDAIGFALFTSDALTVGGRYYGDTFTDPATLP